MSLAYLLLWPTHLRNTYEYGCQVTVSPERVVTYRAPLMPPGEVIHQWRSKRNFAAQHLTNELPVIQPNTPYFLQGHISVTGGGVYLRIQFLDEDGHTLDNTILDGTEGTFTMPPEATDYTIELVNTHHEQVVFHNLLLMDAATAAAYQFTVDPFVGSVTATAKDATAPHVALVVRQGATKPLLLVPDRDNLVVYVTPHQLGNIHWIDKINQELMTFLADHPATSREDSGLAAWQAKLAHWQSLMLREEPK